MTRLTEEQFIDSYRSTVDSLFASVFRWTRGDRSLAEDIVQETYLRAL